MGEDNLKSTDLLAIYGIGIETERFLSQHGSSLSIVGLLDGFRTSGNIYSYPIISLNDVIDKKVKKIIVIARPGSCKAITRRIGDFCRENDILLFDVRGNDLLSVEKTSFAFNGIPGTSRQRLIEEINSSDVISFDLFDTLVMRKVKTYTDLFDLMDLHLRKSGIYIPDFAKNRLFAEKSLSKEKPPRLEEIYDFVLKKIGGCFINASDLAELEWKLDCSVLTVRESVKELLEYALSIGKSVVITSDSYYSSKQIDCILNRFELIGYDELFVSCEYETAKTQKLFGVLADKYSGKRIIHIGDDEFADVDSAKSFGIEAFRIYSAADIFDELGAWGTEEVTESISDHVRVGLFLAHIFNSPFLFEEDKRVTVEDAFDIGYLFCAPMISDFVLWMRDCVRNQAYEQILFGARDGYVIGRLFRMLEESKKSYYFLSSRTAAIRAGVENNEDIKYVDSMKFFGIPEEALSVRYGIEIDDITKIDKNTVILEKAEKQRENYRKYINKLGIDDSKIAMFDFVAKGTTQMYLQRLFSQHMKGFYFLWLESDYMADKGLDIEPFYSEEEKEKSAIFENYYILETMLTSPYSQMEEMDDEGNPIFVEETRSEASIKVFERAQRGIIAYFEDYLNILPDSVRIVNKKLDELLLSFVNKVNICDDDFLSLTVEDPFFGRMTDIRDLLG